MPPNGSSIKGFMAVDLNNYVPMDAAICIRLANQQAISSGQAEGQSGFSDRVNEILGVLGDGGSYNRRFYIPSDNEKSLNFRVGENPPIEIPRPVVTIVGSRCCMTDFKIKSRQTAAHLQAPSNNIEINVKDHEAVMHVVTISGEG